jgi:NAD(P)-dependent dehydrogenase (short-subunit alcohol dehydrogenase family)
MTGLLQDRVALITGAASGIGRASAQLFARQGARVVVADINADGGQAVVDGIRAEGGDAIFVRADMGRMADVAALVQTALARFGRLDVLFSNAFINRRGDAIQMTEAAWDETLNVSLKATWMLAHHALPSMLAGGGGTIVITGSVQALRGHARAVAYQAAKGGLLALTRSLAFDFAPSIRVNTVLPGAINTATWDKFSPEQLQAVGQGCPLRRMGTPEEIAQAALFLASDMSSYMTGQSIVVDGGVSAVIEVPEDD